MTKQDEWHMNIQKAVHHQAEDEGLWYMTDFVSESYLQESLRDLHRVIEENDLEALARIIERTE